MRIPVPHVFGQKLCEALGLDPAKTRRVVVVYEATDAVKVYVQQYLMEHETDAVLAALEEAKPDAEIEQVECIHVDQDGNVFPTGR